VDDTNVFNSNTLYPPPPQLTLHPLLGEVKINLNMLGALMLNMVGGEVDNLGVLQ
jgi:hypothetical protein